MLLKFWQFFAYLKWHGHGPLAFQKCIIFSFFGQIYFWQKSSFLVKMFAKKSTKNDEIYIFEKPMVHDHAISNMQKIAKILIT